MLPRWLYSMVGILVVVVGWVMVPATSVTQAQTEWVFTDRQFRVPLTIDIGNYTREDKVAEYAINFTELLNEVEQSGAFEPDSLRVVETHIDGSPINNEVVFQFDRDSDYDAENQASGTLLFLLQGTTVVDTTRSFDVYFDVTGSSYTLPSFTPQISVSDVSDYRGQDSFLITTADATYYYHKRGAAFASIIDRDGNDWISYYPTTGSKSAGEYRGIPNLGAVFHPGYTKSYTAGAGNTRQSKQGSTSTIIAQGPLKLSIRSVSSNGDWEAVWEVYPTHATMTLLRVGGPYWFLYEGTPGGNLNTTGSNQDTMVRATGALTGVQTDLSETWDTTLPASSWVYFDDAWADQSLYLVHHNTDSRRDSYYPQQNADRVMPANSTDNGAMTVFGFGRRLMDSSVRMSNTPAQLTIGLADQASIETTASTINAAYRDVSVMSDSPQMYELPNRSPVAEDDTAQTMRDTVVTIDALGNDTDPDGDTLDVSVIAATHGTAEVNDALVVFTPATGFVGVAQIQYEVRDGRGGTDSALIIISVFDDTIPNLPPVANNDTAITTPDVAVTIDVLANDEDADGDTLDVLELTEPSTGSVVKNDDNTLTYTPLPDFTGGVSFTYTIVDEVGESDSAEVVVTVDALQQTPHVVYLPILIK
ncbi:MAG: cadherin-like domain-containing protein [Chloroflexota bacterium]